MSIPPDYDEVSPPDPTALVIRHVRAVVAGHESTTAEATAELILALGVAQPEEINPDYLPTTTTKGTTT